MPTSDLKSQCHHFNSTQPSPIICITLFAASSDSPPHSSGLPLSMITPISANVLSYWLPPAPGFCPRLCTHPDPSVLCSMLCIVSMNLTLRRSSRCQCVSCPHSLFQAHRRPSGTLRYMPFRCCRLEWLVVPSECSGRNGHPPFIRVTA